MFHTIAIMALLGLAERLGLFAWPRACAFALYPAALLAVIAVAGTSFRFMERPLLSWRE